MTLGFSYGKNKKRPTKSLISLGVYHYLKAKAQRYEIMGVIYMRLKYIWQNRLAENANKHDFAQRSLDRGIYSFALAESQFHCRIDAHKITACKFDQNSVEL